MIKGWIRTSLIDFPGEIASAVFLGGCNFRCPMCHNADLVLHPGQLADIRETEILEYLDRRRGRISGIVVSGGEPCLAPELEPFLAELRAHQVKIKLDTNGYFPEILAALLQKELVDFVAMDIKAPPGKYPLLTGIPDLDISPINDSIQQLINSKIPCEFRTTVVPDWITVEDISQIARWLPGAKRYTLQQFRPQGCLDARLNDLQPYPADTLRKMQEIAKMWIPQVQTRGEEFP